MASNIISGNDSGAATTDSPDSEGLFGKLSAELKNEIFELALVAPSAIEIRRKGRFVPCTASEASRIQSRKDRPNKLVHFIKAFTTTAKGKGIKRSKASSSVGAGLLRTSRSIRAIALPMFYGMNEFRFADDRAFHHFIFETAPTARPLLRQIDIRLANVNSFYLPPLGPRHGMRPVKVELYKAGKPTCAFGVWDVLKSFVRGKGNSSKEQKARFDLLDLSFLPGCLKLNDKLVTGNLNAEQKEQLCDGLLRAWGSTISWQSIDRYDFFPEGVSGYVD